MNQFGEEAEETLYKQGLTYLDERKFKAAVDCFFPLAEKGYVNCQHNLAFCLYNLGEKKEVYRWYLRAADQGFQPSKNNLTKMNLLDLLLPNELLTHVTSFLTLEERINFQMLSRRTSSVFISAITKTNLLTSANPYAKDLYSRFVNVRFEPMPKAIKLSRLAKSNGSIEVHFCDVDHLKEIVEETPSINVYGENKLYFVRDQAATCVTELVATDGDLQTGYFTYKRVIFSTLLRIHH